MGIVATGDKAWAPSSSTLHSDFFEVATGDKAWAPSSGTLHSDFFEDVDNEIPEKNEEENLRNDGHILNDAARLSRQIEKLCNAADNMSQATSSLTPIMDPYGIPQVVKVLDSKSEKFQKLVRYSFSH
ncbi:hypothetical protein Goklo_023366 [Gossypium klotzschianum]|uniref:Uncharacterized protein n=2 Tax=Gossypium TaxID=3633 RepID=A0A7J8TQF6_9ROSI|nr:hypothetical protein [Gossypium klotzschianum]